MEWALYFRDYRFRMCISNYVFIMFLYATTLRVNVRVRSDLYILIKLTTSWWRWRKYFVINDVMKLNYLEKINNNGDRIKCHILQLENAWRFLIKYNIAHLICSEVNFRYDIFSLELYSVYTFKVHIYFVRYDVWKRHLCTSQGWNNGFRPL